MVAITMTVVGDWVVVMVVVVVVVGFLRMPTTCGDYMRNAT